VDLKAHWEKVYTEKAPDAVSWYRPHLDASLALIDRIAGDRSSSIIDIGGGESTLVDDLLLHGYENVTVLDLSRTALEFSQKRLGPSAKHAQWIVADITQTELEPNAYDLWHDRAVFHFLTTPERRTAYVRQILRAVKPGGHVVIATFGPEGPTRCSGLDVVRYDPESVLREFGPSFQLLDSFTEEHHTPFGTTQQFQYCCLRVQKNPAGVLVRSKFNA